MEVHKCPGKENKQRILGAQCGSTSGPRDGSHRQLEGQARKGNRCKKVKSVERLAMFIIQLIESLLSPLSPNEPSPYAWTSIHCHSISVLIVHSLGRESNVQICLIYPLKISITKRMESESNYMMHL